MDIFGLEGVVVLLGDGDLSTDGEFPLGNLAGLLLVVSLGDGLADLSRVGNGVLVWDDDVAGTDLGVGGSVLGTKSSVVGTTVGVGCGESAIGIEGGERSSSERSIVSIGTGTSSEVASGSSWSLLARCGVVASSSGRGGSNEGNESSEFHV